MPIYEYVCKACGRELEEIQRMSDSPLRKCPSCGALKLQRKVSLTSFQLKGDGWFTSGGYGYKGSGTGSGGGGSESGGSDSGSKAASDTSSSSKSKSKKKVSDGSCGSSCGCAPSKKAAA